MMGLPTFKFDLDRVRSFIHNRLCQLGDFEPEAFKITERLVVRSGTPCGVHFCLHGPRNVKFSAVLDLRRRAVLFYGSDGQRLERQAVTAA